MALKEEEWFEITQKYAVLVESSEGEREKNHFRKTLSNTLKQRLEMSSSACRSPIKTCTEFVLADILLSERTNLSSEQSVRKKEKSERKKRESRSFSRKALAECLAWFLCFIQSQRVSQMSFRRSSFPFVLCFVCKVFEFRDPGK